MMGFVFALEHATPNPLKKARWSNYPLAWLDACQCYQHMRGLFLRLNMQLQPPLKKPGGRTCHWHGFMHVNVIDT